jgi:hypothetical protein
VVEVPSVAVSLGHVEAQPVRMSMAVIVDARPEAALVPR